MKPKELYNLLTKYHLVRDTEYNGGELYVFPPKGVINIGYVVGYGLPEMPIVSFAQGVKFSANSGVPSIICYGFEKNITEDKYETKLATLEKQFHKAVRDYKKYLIKEKLKNIKKDFV